MGVVVVMGVRSGGRVCGVGVSSGGRVSGMFVVVVVVAG